MAQESGKRQKGALVMREKWFLKVYVVVWLVAVILFHILMFALPNNLLDPSTGRFWIVYSAIIVSFLGQAGCSWLYASRKRKQERFLMFPVAAIGYTALLASFLLGVEAVAKPFLPDWMVAAAAIAAGAFYALSVVKTAAAAEMVMELEDRVEEQTSRLRSMTAQARALSQSADGDMKKYAKAVYEELRYSDPVSAPQMFSVEEGLKEVYDAFSKAVREKDEVLAAQRAKEFSSLLKARNELCKGSKH